jgi:ketosteroid isomerase-like protein
MSDDRIQIIHGVIDAWNRQDLDGLLALTDADAEYVNAPEAVEPGTRHGHEGFTLVLRAQWEALPGGLQVVDRVHDRGDKLITVGQFSRDMPGSDARLGNPILISWEFRDGKVTRIEILGAGSGFREAIEEAGLSEKDIRPLTS